MNRQSTLNADTPSININNIVLRSSLRNKTGLKIGCFNSRSIFNKISEICNLIDGVGFDVICVTETLLSDNISDTALNIPGFSVYRNDRTRHGGGVCVFVRNHIKSKVVCQFQSVNVELLLLEMKINGITLLIGTVYKPPKFDAVSELNQILDEFSDKYTDILLCGDFNYNYLRQDHRAKKFYSMLNRFSLSVINTIEPTYYYRRDNQIFGSLLDLIITNTSKISFFNQVSVGCLDGHDFLYFVYDMNVKQSPQTITFRDYSKINFNDLTCFMSNLPWNNIYLCSDVNAQVEYFNNFVNTAYEKFVPVKTIRLSKTKSKPPWFTEELDEQINLRDFLYNRSRLLTGSESSNAYKVQRNKVNTLKRSLKAQYLNKQLSSDLPAKEFWKNVNNLGVGKQAHSSSSLPYSAEEFANYYSSGSNTPVNSDVNFTSNIDGFSFRNVTMLELEQSFYSIKSNSIGLDGISNKFLKIIFPIISTHLLYLVNCMITKSFFPSAWKSTKILPIPKTLNPKGITDFRPISILPILSKVFEKLIKAQMLKYLLEKNLLDKCQSAYRPNHSTESAILNVVDDIRRTLDKGEECVLVSFDFSKAFDNINQATLLYKLNQQFNFSPSACNLILSYVSNRSQVIWANSTFSNRFSLYRGVPQGSVLGPLLFLIYINDLPNSIRHSKYHLFADDLQIYQEISKNSSSDDIAKINLDIEEIGKWACSNSLTLNNRKTQAIILQKQATSTMLTPLLIGTEVIAYSEKIKTLGFVLEQNLSWDSHIDAICSRIRFMLRRLWSITKDINCEIRRKLFFAYIFPHFLYGCSVLYGMNEYNFYKLQLVFNACTRYIYGLRKFDHVSEYNKKVLPLSLREYYDFRICYSIFKIIFNQSPYYLFIKLEKLKSTRLQNILVIANKTKLLNLSFFVRGISVWNNLSTFIKSSSSVACFRRRYFQDKI